MNRDKAWLEIGGVPLIERALAAAKPVAGRLGIIINAANPQVERYERLAERYGARLIFDLHDHLGPLGGIHTALTHCVENESALILACDLPLITTEFLSFLVEIHHSPTAADVTVPMDRSDRPQPLSAIYNQSSGALVATIERMITADELKVDRLFSLVSTRRVAFAEFAHLMSAENFFTNVNTPEEYRAAIRQIS